MNMNEWIVEWIELTQRVSAEWGLAWLWAWTHHHIIDIIDWPIEEYHEQIQEDERPKLKQG